MRYSYGLWIRCEVYVADGEGANNLSGRVTRRRFLEAAGAGAAWITLTSTLGCEPAERASEGKPGRSGPERTDDSRRSRTGGVVSAHAGRRRESHGLQGAALPRRAGAHLLPGRRYHLRSRRVRDPRLLLPRGDADPRGERLPGGPPRGPHHP